MSQLFGTGDGGGAAATAPTAPVALLAAELAPPVLGFPIVRRPRLLSQLSRGVTRTPVTLLSGPAGWGKTVLASSWTRAQTGHHVGWLTLDEVNDEPATFWTYLVAALAQAGVEIPDLPSPARGEPVPPEGTIALAAHVWALPEPVVLIVDNADRLTDPDLLARLDLLLRHAKGQLRLVLCGRADPGLPLHRYRVADSVTEIRADELAFTAEETGALLASLAASVPADTAAALAERTEGWAAALHLAAAPLKRGLDVEAVLGWLSADVGSVAQYVFAEVLEHQPAAVRRFLLRVSVTDELWPGLLARLTGRADADRVLAALAASNAFVERSPTAPGGYRMHGLFRELLAAQLAYEDPRSFAAAHRTCATWYGDAGRRSQAIEHAAVNGDWATVAPLQIDDLAVGRLLAGERRPIPQMPTGPPGPEAAVLRTAAALARGSVPDSAELELTASAASSTDGRPTLRASAAVVCAAAAAAGPAPAAVGAGADLAEALVSSLPDDRQRERRGLTVAVTAARAAALLRTDADDDMLLDALRAALAVCEAADALRPRARCLADLALLEALRGRLVRAEALVDSHQALSAKGRLPQIEGSGAAATAAAWVWGERAENGRARRWLARAEECPPHSDLIRPLLAVLHSRLLRASRDFDGAEDALHIAGGDTSPPRWVREQILAEEVRLRFARGQGREGLELLDRFPAASPWPSLLRATAGALGLTNPVPEPPTVDPEHPLAVAVQTAIVRASSHADHGDVPNAVAEAEAALRLAEPERMRRSFNDAPPSLRRLLRTQPRLATAGAWLSLTAVPVATPRRPPDDAVGHPSPVTAELSEREVEVLQHLDQMLSTEELAAAMFISVNTVRTHIRSILRKLSATRRTDALRYARQLQII